MESKDVLLEIGFEELSINQQQSWIKNFSEHLQQQLCAATLPFDNIKMYSTPRRLALLIEKLACNQPPQQSQRLGPKIEHAYDTNGMPTIACMGFARSLGIQADQLQSITTPSGVRVGIVTENKGENSINLLPDLINTSIQKTTSKQTNPCNHLEGGGINRARWVVLLFGRDVIHANILNQKTTRETRGHRFLHPTPLGINQPGDYAALLYSRGYVVADPSKRRDLIKKQLLKIAAGQRVILSEQLLTENTALTEWPQVLKGRFDLESFTLPPELIIATLEQKQRVFGVTDQQGKLLPQFLLVCNIECDATKDIITGYSRSLHAHLQDTQYLYKKDLQQSFTDRSKALKQLTFHKDLGSWEEKTRRIVKLATHISTKLPTETDSEAIKAAGLLCKCDINSEIVATFPNLKGAIAHQYALHQGAQKECADAIQEHYLPQNNDAPVPTSQLGSIIAIADKIDTVVGIFGTYKTLTEDCTPYNIASATLGILRTIIEKQLPLDLMDLIKHAKQGFKNKFSNNEVIDRTFDYIYQQLKNHYINLNTNQSVLATVEARFITKPYDFHCRIHAVSQLRKHPQGPAIVKSLIKINDILSQQTRKVKETTIKHSLCQSPQQQAFAQKILTLSQNTPGADQYASTLLELTTTLSEPINQFLVSIESPGDTPSININRIIILKTIVSIFRQIADITKLSFIAEDNQALQNSCDLLS